MEGGDWRQILQSLAALYLMADKPGKNAPSQARHSWASSSPHWFRSAPAPDRAAVREAFACPWGLRCAAVGMSPSPRAAASHFVSAPYGVECLRPTGRAPAPPSRRCFIWPCKALRKRTLGAGLSGGERRADQGCADPVRHAGELQLLAPLARGARPAVKSLRSFAGLTIVPHTEHG